MEEMAWTYAGGSKSADEDPAWMRATDTPAPNPNDLLKRFRAALTDGDWRLALCELMADWPLAEETVGGQLRLYLIAGEAFDWRALAERVLDDVGSEIPVEQRDGVLFDWSPTLGLPEETFRRALGVDKHRAHLNYLYGVSVERALLVSLEEEICKRRAGNGYRVTEHHYEEAYERLYGASHEALWDEFRASGGGTGSGPKNGRRRSAERVSMAVADAFTYWLFKRRIERLDPARVASDTRKGLNQMERIRQAHARRLGGDLRKAALPNAEAIVR